MTTPNPNPPTNPTPESTVPTPDPRDAEIAMLKAELAKKEQAEAQAKIKAENQANNDFAENLVKDGKLTPAHKDMVVAVLNAIDTANRASPLNFGEGDGAKPLNQVFKDSLSAGLLNTKAHLFGESAGKTTTTPPLQFNNLPQQVQVDSDSMAKHQEILAYAEANKVDYTTAVMALGN